MTTVQDPRPEAGQAPQDRPTFDVHHPGTGDLVGTWPVQSAAEVEDTVARARLAAEWWQGIGYAERRKRLDAFRGVIARRIHQLAHLVHDEMGKPHGDAFLEVALVLDHLAWAGKHAPKVLGPQKRPTGLINANLKATVEHHPLGVVGVIGPWNYPVFTPMGSIVYALAGGNAVVFKPSEFTPGVGAWLVNAFAEVVPEHPVLQLVTGDGSTGAALCRAGVDKVAFTGSTDVGKAIARAVAGTDKKVTLELGGKAANIVFDDAPIDQAIEGIVNGIYFNQGHVCCAGSRLLLQESVADEALASLKRRLTTLRLGDPLDKNTDIGAINSSMQLSKIEELTASGEAEGAERWSPTCAIPDKGFWFPPTVFTNVTQAHRIAREEIFGPVLSVLTFRTPEEAVAKANNTPFGLSAGIWTEKGSRILWMANQMRAGIVWANTFNRFDPTSPFGGFKESGFGREGGVQGLGAYLNVEDPS